MKRKLLSLALTLAMCLTAVPALAAANPYTDDWGSRFSNVLDRTSKNFTGCSGRKGANAVYYLDPNASVRIGKRVEKIGYLQIDKDEITTLDKSYTIEKKDEGSYTRDQFEKEFGLYDMYCLITRTDSKDREYEYLYFLFDDSAADNATNYDLSGTVLKKYRGSGGAMLIPDGVTRIEGMFMDASTAADVTSVTFPSSVREIDSWTFNGCTELSAVTLPNGLEKLGNGAFTGCTRLSAATIPASLTEIGTAAFADCGLSRVTLQAGLTSIGDSMFSGCQKLMVINIPSSVTQVGSRAFAGCTALNNVLFENGNTKIEADAFTSNFVPGLINQGPQLTISAPSGGSVEAYCTARKINFRSTGTVSGGTTAPSTPDTIPASGTAIASAQTVSVDGKKTEFQMYALKDANGNLTNYIKLRDMAYVLNGTKAQFSVGFDGTISLTAGQAYTAAGGEMTTPFSGDRAYKGGTQSIKVNGSAVDMTAITLTDDAGGAYNYFKLRDLGKVLGFNVGWNNGVIIESDKPYSE